MSEASENRRADKAGNLGAAQVKAVGGGFRAAFPALDTTPVNIFAEASQRERENFTQQNDALQKMFDDWEPDTRPEEIAANTARSAELMSKQNTAIAQLVELTLSNLAVSRAQQEQSERNEKFTKKMAWATVIFAGSSLVASIVAIVLSSS